MSNTPKCSWKARSACYLRPLDQYDEYDIQGDHLWGKNVKVFADARHDHHVCIRETTRASCSLSRLGENLADNGKKTYASVGAHPSSPTIVRLSNLIALSAISTDSADLWFRGKIKTDFGPHGSLFKEGLMKSHPAIQKMDALYQDLLEDIHKLSVDKLKLDEVRKILSHFIRV